jgi:hypothetical protein
MPPYTTPVNSPDRDGRRPRWAKTPRTPWTPSPWMVALKQSAGDVASAVSAAFKPKPIKIESPSASPSRDIPIPSIEVDPAAWLLSHASSPGTVVDMPTHKPGRRHRLKLTWKRREAEAAAAAAAANSAAATSAAATSIATASDAATSVAATSVAAAPAPGMLYLNSVTCMNHTDFKSFWTCFSFRCWPVWRSLRPCLHARSRLCVQRRQ